MSRHLVPNGFRRALFCHFFSDADDQISSQALISMVLKYWCYCLSEYLAWKNQFIQLVSEGIEVLVYQENVLPRKLIDDFGIRFGIFSCSDIMFYNYFNFSIYICIDQSKILLYARSKSETHYVIRPCTNL